MAHKLDQQQLTYDGNIEFGGNGNQKIAQSFKPSIEASLSKVLSSLTSNGTPLGGITCDLYSDNNGVPGNLLISADSALPAASVGDNVPWVFSTIFLLAPNNSYWIVFSRNVAQDNTNDYEFKAGSSSVDRYGRGKTLVYNGTNWLQNDHTVYEDLVFQEFYNDSTVTKKAASHYSAVKSKTHVRQDQAFPVNPIVGDYFWDAFNNRMCIYNGNQWVFRQFTTTTSTSTSTTTTSTSTTTTSTSSSTSSSTSITTSTSTTTTL